MKTTNGVLVVGAAIGALAGCGPSPAKSNAPATASAACVALHAAGAASSARCNGGSVADWLAYENSYEDCAAYDRHVAEGTVVYARDMFDTCLAQYDLPCKQGLSCFYDVLRGQVADGQRCQDAEVCGTTSTCLQVDFNATCGEVCVRGANENEACGLYCGASGPPCVDVQLCRPDLTCVNSVCVPPKAAGAACTIGDACAWPTICSAGTGTCTVPRTGDPCGDDTGCLATDFCQQGACAVRRAIGASCADAPTGCAPWAKCDANGTCVAAGRPGGACFPIDGQPDSGYCWVGTCTADGVCAANGKPGESCESVGCVTGSSCDSATLMCVACNP